MFVVGREAVGMSRRVYDSGPLPYASDSRGDATSTLVSTVAISTPLIFEQRCRVILSVSALIISRLRVTCWSERSRHYTYSRPLTRGPCAALRGRSHSAVKALLRHTEWINIIGVVLNRPGAGAE